MKKVMNKFLKTRSEKEETLNYLQTVVEHVGIGLITFNTKGDVELFNQNGKKNFPINSCKKYYPDWIKKLLE